MKYLLLIFICFTSLGHTVENELELGVGLLSMSMNHYRGSDQSKFYAIPYPYFYYKSERVEAEPSYIHGILYRNKRFSLRLSVLAGLKIDSDENEAREGMPGLGYTLEAGPMFFSTLWESQNHGYRLDLGIPWRQVFATDLSSYFRHIGAFAIPFLNFIIMPNNKNLQTRHELSIAAMFGSHEYHNYFYRVPGQYATATRPTYETTKGYTGLNLMWLMQKKYKHFSLMPFIRYDNLTGAVYRKSPLVKTKSYWIFALVTNFLI